MCVLAYGIMTFSDAHSDVFTSMQGSMLGPGTSGIPPRIETAAVRLSSSPLGLPRQAHLEQELCKEDQGHCPCCYGCNAALLSKRQLTSLLACCTMKGRINALMGSAMLQFLIASQMFASIDWRDWDALVKHVNCCIVQPEQPVLRAIQLFRTNYSRCQCQALTDALPRPCPHGHLHAVIP